MLRCRLIATVSTIPKIYSIVTRAFVAGSTSGDQSSDGNCRAGKGLAASYFSHLTVCGFRRPRGSLADRVG